MDAMVMQVEGEEAQIDLRCEIAPQTGHELKLVYRSDDSGAANVVTEVFRVTDVTWESRPSKPRNYWLCVVHARRVNAKPIDCPKCKGAGSLPDGNCPKCQGLKLVMPEEPEPKCRACNGQSRGPLVVELGDGWYCANCVGVLVTELRGRLRMVD